MVNEPNHEFNINHASTVGLAALSVGIFAGIGMILGPVGTVRQLILAVLGGMAGGAFAAVLDTMVNTGAASC